MLNETRRILRDERRLFASHSGRVLRAYDHILMRVGPLAWMPLRRHVFRVRVRDLEHALLARIGTTDFFTITEIFSDGDYRPLLDTPRPSVRTIVDLGANVGYSIRFWMENFRDSRIFAAEPDPENFSLCRRNVELAGEPGRVELTQACVLATQGEALLEVGSGGESGFTIVRAGSRAKKAVEVRAVTVPELIGKLGSEAPIDVLKCDIEGSEGELFKASSAWINRVRLAVVETHAPYSVGELLVDIAAAGGDFEVLKRVDKSAGFASLVFLKNRNAPVSVR